MSRSFWLGFFFISSGCVFILVACRARVFIPIVRVVLVLSRALFRCFLEVRLCKVLVQKNEVYVICRQKNRQFAPAFLPLPFIRCILIIFLHGLNT